ncbi:hypothetical protein F8388_004125 [Cannabis sativa]|uniref:Pentatricopeptide repeat-containing protein n=1 Tax=Cannabis sativa TaxID=3483 RepID=A0A7J6EDV8_CANSA|nr:hypothetical protein F8388_004125 [Cannabis sativa]
MKSASPTHYDLPNIDQTRQIHAHMIKTHFDNNLQNIPLSFRPHISPAAQCNFLITSYNDNNFPECSLKIDAHMRNVDHYVENFIVPSILKACGQCSLVPLGKEVHGYVLKNGVDKDVFVRDALIQMYSECGSVVSRRLVFDHMTERDVVSWSTMIRSCVRNRLLGEALELVREMHYLGIKPNMYAKCGNLTYAERLFNGLTYKTVVSWTVMIAGYISTRTLGEVAKLFEEMRDESIFPNEITVLSLITECDFVGAMKLGKLLHSYLLRNRFVVSLPLATALLDMHGKCGDLRKARGVFDGVKDKDVMIWSDMISADAHASYANQACGLFVRMTEEGLRKNKQRLEVDTLLKTALVDMYAKCGDIDGAGY